MTRVEFLSVAAGTRVTTHALNLGDRLVTTGFKDRALSTAPLAIRCGEAGVAVLFRYGAVVLIGVTPQDERALLDELQGRIEGRLENPEDETTTLAFTGGAEDHIQSGAPIQLRDMSPERLLIIADVLAKSVVLAHDEREVAKVFDVIEPFARELANHGRARRNRKGMLRLLGNALLVQNRVSGHVAVAEKPDALWDRPDLERLYARLEDEYELSERVDALNRKLAVLAETANTLADIIDTRRSLRLELIVVILITFEIIVTLYQIYAGRHY